MARNKAIKSYKLASGETRYMFKIYLGSNPITGKRKETTRRGFKTTTAAKNEYNRLKVEAANGFFTENKTYAAVYEEWLTGYEKTVKPSTLLKTMQIFEDHILPQFGHIKIQKIDYKICKSAALVWFENLKFNKKIEHYASIIFETAYNLGIIQRNPMKMVKIRPKEHKFQEKSYYKREELISFLEAAKQESIKKHAYLRLLSYAGIRRAEGFALYWGDIDFDKQEIIVDKAVSYDRDGTLIISTTKTSDHRVLKIDCHTLDILTEWRDIQCDLYDELDDNNLIFSDKKNNIYHPSNAWKWCNDIQSKYNLKKVPPHGLRRTHATMYYSSGAEHYEIKKRLGHSLNDITSDIYIIETDEIKKQAFDGFIKYMRY